MGRLDRFRWLYVYQGCAKHGCKIGVSHEHGLANRLHYCRVRCPRSTEFARTFRLDNAYEIEQRLISTLDARKIGPGREWFDISVDELLIGIEFMRDLLAPSRSPIRRYRVVAGHFLHAET